MSRSSDESPSIGVEQRRCVDACRICHDACLAKLDYLTESRGRDSAGGPLEVLRVCVERCDAVITAFDRGEDPKPAIAACAAAVAPRALWLLQAAESDPQLADAAEACRLCAAECLLALTPPIDYDEVVVESFPASDPPAH